VAKASVATGKKPAARISGIKIVKKVKTANRDTSIAAVVEDPAVAIAAAESALREGSTES
jgi:Tfp pilus assembly protein PilX